MYRLVAMAVCIALNITSSAVAAEPAAIVVHVVDAANNPVSNATIRLAPAGALLGTTDANGTAAIKMPAGTLVIASANGRSSSATPLRNGETDLLLPIAVIGRAKTSGFGGQPPVNRTSAASLLSSNLAGTLRFDPQYRSSAEGGSDSAEVNGVPLPLPPAGGGVGGSRYSDDLFESYSPDDANGSTIPNFHLVTPTAELRETAGLTDGRFGDTGIRATLSGRAQRLGYGISALAEGDEGDLDGLSFRDLSGSTYDHTQGNRAGGGTWNFLYDLGSTQIAYSGIAEQRGGRDISNVVPGPLPQGFGPQASQHSHDATNFVTIDHSAGRDHLFYVGVSFEGGGDVDHRDATFLNEPASFFTAYRYHGTYQYAKISRTMGVATAYADATQQTFTLDNSGAIGSADGSAKSTSEHLGIDTTRNALSYGAKAGMTDVSGSLPGTFAESSLHLDYRRPTVTAHVGYTSAPSQMQESFSIKDQVLGDPAVATIDCSGGHAVVNAPAVVGSSHPYKSDLDANVHVKLTESLDVSAGGYASVEHDALALGLAEQPLNLPVGYASEVSAFYEATCGTPTPLPSSEIFGQRYVQVNELRSHEAFIAAKQHSGAFTMSGFIEVLSRSVVGAPISGVATSTTLLAGQQLPYVPLQRANLMFAYDGQRLVAAADALYTAANNEQNLPGHVETFFGIGYKMQSGLFSLSCENPLGSYSGAFVSSRYAVPVATSRGPFSIFATPVTSIWTLKYQFTPASRKP